MKQPVNGQDRCAAVRQSDGCETYLARVRISAGHLQATLIKLLTYGVLRSTQPPTLRGTGNGVVAYELWG